MIEIKHKDTGVVLLRVEAEFLAGASLEGASLAQADLREAYLRWAKLNGADLHGADLRRANLTQRMFRSELISLAQATSSPRTREKPQHAPAPRGSRHPGLNAKGFK